MNPVGDTPALPPSPASTVPATSGPIDAYPTNSTIPSACGVNAIRPTSRCVTTDFVILGANEIEKVPGNPQSTEAGVLATFLEFNRCTLDFTRGTAMTGPETFSMPNLGAASASVPMQMTFSDFDSASQTYTHTVLGTATATIQWTGVGAIEKIKEKDKIVFPNGDWLKISLKGNSRAASVAGTFILNGEDLIAGITSDASLTDVTFGSHTKSKN